MLNRVLKSVGSGNTRNIGDIASELKISRDLTSQMIRELVRLGYLKQWKTDNKCSGCPGCGDSAGCKQGSGVLWILTRKGESYVYTQ